MNLPNKITIGRILLTCVFIILLFQDGLYCKIAALLTYLAATISDYFDGYFAKKYDQKTNFGMIMDPVADKFLVLTAFFSFAILGIIPLWMVVLIALRDVIITTLRIKALLKNEVLAAEKGGKQKTVSQMFTIFVILIFILVRGPEITKCGCWGMHTDDVFCMTIFLLMLITLVFTLHSGVLYLTKYRKYLR
ncbi:MAG: CDP-diacylglycerol--glycerol-3-phosphate 3-phosphatidyltransferase [Candidatus Omnitrophica bacterium]|nr:CDP-diacylglycerol--glycerol-3-phosphate 3-phosphatidyltransferase [Candidatus Omnitrophota bacterium]